MSSTVVPFNTKKATYYKDKHDLIDFFYKFIWWKAIRCPNSRSLKDSSKHDPNCTLCDNGFLYIEPTEIQGFITGLTRKEYYGTEGMWHIGTGAVTVPCEYKLDYWDKLIVIGSDTCPNQEVTRRYSQLVKRGSGDSDQLKYRAVNMVAARKTIQGTPDTAVEYTVETDFRVNPTDGSVQWVSLNKPAEDDIYSVMYTHNPVYIVQEVLHVFRDRINIFKRQNVGIGDWEKGAIQAMVKLDFLVKYD